MTNDASIDDISISFQSIPSHIAGKSSYPCTISKQPMLREVGQGEGTITVIWETDSYLRNQHLDWGWEPGRTMYSQPIQSTFVGDCNYIHKCEIRYNDEIYDDIVVSQRKMLFYRVRCGSEESDLYRYVIPPPTFTFTSKEVPDTRIAIISDNQYGSKIMRHLAYDIQNFHPELLLMGGDIVNRGYVLEEWGRFFWYPLEVAQLSQRTPVVITRGNHDGQSGYAFAYTAGVRNRDWFAFSHGAVRYIVLDSNADGAIAPQQTQWLKNELQSKEFDEALFRLVIFS